MPKPVVGPSTAPTSSTQAVVNKHTVQVAKLAGEVNVISSQVLSAQASRERNYQPTRYVQVQRIGEDAKTGKLAKGAINQHGSAMKDLPRGRPDTKSSKLK